jgi:hypothetical protein
MPKLSDEDQCMLSLMEITGFPMEIKHGLYTMKFEDWTSRYAPTRDGNISTADFSRVVKTFERWKEERNEN